MMAFLNLVRNIADKRTPNNFKMYHKKDSENVGSQEQSQTGRAFTYAFCIGGPKINFIISSSGSDVSDEALKDKAIIESVSELLKKVQYLKGLVMFTDETRHQFNVSQTYFIRSLLSVLPKEIVNNIIVVGTNCSISTQNLDIEAVRKDIEKVRKETINPIALVVLQKPPGLWSTYRRALDRYRALGHDMPHHEPFRRNKELESAYEENIIAIGEFLDAIKNLQPVPVRCFADPWIIKASEERHSGEEEWGEWCLL